MRRGAPRGLGEAVRAVRDRAAPATLLGQVQRVWPGVVGETIAAEAAPVGEREGIIRVSCRSAVWAQELDLMRPELTGRLNVLLERPIAGIRFTADAARHDPP
jgi:predicted nucleic acid-binding Zn ribbon protein